MKVFRIGAVTSVALLVAIAVAACGGDDDGTGASTSPTNATAESPEATESDLPTVIEVSAKEFAFEPANFAVPQGVPVTVKVKDTGLSLHTLTVFSDEEFTLPVPGADVQVAPTVSAEFTTTFDAAGTLYFRCGIHPDQMQGEITVE